MPRIKTVSIQVRMTEPEKADLLRVLDQKYMGVSISEWFRRKAREEVERFEREQRDAQS